MTSRNNQNDFKKKDIREWLKEITKKLNERNIATAIFYIISYFRNK